MSVVTPVPFRDRTWVTAVDAADDPRLADFRSVGDPAVLRARGLFVAEGRLAVERLLASRFRTRAVLLTASALDRLRPALAAAFARPSLAAATSGASGSIEAPTGAAATVAAAEAGRRPDVLLAAAAVLRGVTGFRFHRGCLALGVRPAGPPPGGVGLPAPEPGRPVVILDRLSDPDNVGTIFRSAAAFGAAGVVLAPACADPLYRKAIRTSMGTTLTLPFAAAAAWPDVLRRLQAAGARLVALTPDVDATGIDTFVAGPAGRRPLALLLGNEGDGISPAALALADDRVRIGIEPAVDSLNVGAAAAIALQRIRAAAAGRATASADIVRAAGVIPGAGGPPAGRVTLAGGATPADGAAPVPGATAAPPGPRDAGSSRRGDR